MEEFRQLQVRGLVAGMIAIAPGVVKAAPECSHYPQSLEGLPISSISIDNRNIFDPEIEGQDLWIHRVANILHIKTRKKTIEGLILFSREEPYSERLVEETERIIRSQDYIHDARIIAEPDCEEGVALKVVSTDNWTLTPSVSVGRSGGETRTSFKIDERNLLGMGTAVKLKSVSNEDRDEDSISIHDPNWFGNHKSMKLTISNNSDGHLHEARLQRPFFQLDSKYAWSVNLASRELENPVYTRGLITDKVGEKSDSINLSYGWSEGLVGDLVERFRLGWVVAETEYFQTADFPMSVIPDSSSDSFPFFSYRLLWPRYMTLRNFLAMGIDEDISIGDSFSISVGWKARAFGSDERGVVLGLGYDHGSQLAERTLVFVNLSLGIDAEEASDDTGNISFRGRLFHYKNQSHNYLLNAAIEAKLNAEPFEQYVLGGNTGLKGYPIRYQKGDTRVTFSIEDRLYFDWYPLQLLKFGVAAFAEAGSAWREGEDPDFISDAGFGLRVISTRQSGARVLHADIAFPLSERDQVDSYQVFIKAEAQF